jgi:hypothetical protein
MISVITPEGKLYVELTVPGPEVTGLALRCAIVFHAFLYESQMKAASLKRENISLSLPSTNSPDGRSIIATEVSTSTIYRLALP